MKEEILIHFDLSKGGRIPVSNSNGVFAYFTDESNAIQYKHCAEVTLRRLKLFLEYIEIAESDETSYNELEVIFSELNKLFENEECKRINQPTKALTQKDKWDEIMQRNND